MDMSFFSHFRPRTLTPHALRLQTTWGFGGIATFLVLLQIGTGILLSLAYTPQPVAAYESIQTVLQRFYFGPLIRNMHYWSGHILFAVTVLHLVRVFYTGVWTGRRKWIWHYGLVAAFLIGLANLTGYLLPWDQLAFWAITITLSMVYTSPFGVVPPEVNANTLHVFYIGHTAIIPGVLVISLLFHFWYLRKNGGVSSPENGVIGRVPASRLFLKEVSMSVLTFAVILLIATFCNAPLMDMANPELTPETIRAPWYFIGIQELLLHLSPSFVWGCLLGLFVFLVAIPSLSEKQATARGTRYLFTLFLLGYVSFSIVGFFFRGPAMTFVLPWNQL